MNTTLPDESAKSIPDFEDIDLHIDGSIDKICEASTSTSSTMRSLWYVIVIVSVLSFAEFWNTHLGNYATERLNHYKDSVNILHEQLLSVAQSKESDLVRAAAIKKLQLDLNQKMFDALNNNDINNIQTVRFPILGNTFDVTDLGLFAGFSFIVLLLILDYILIRKLNNLRIALNAITRRYSDRAEEKVFSQYLEPLPDKMKALEAINQNRRMHHYDSLRMKEVFSVPDKDTPHPNAYYRFINSFGSNIIYIPLIVSGLLLGNDLLNIYFNGLGPDPKNHEFLVTVSIIYMGGIWWISHKCKRQSLFIEKLYQEFRKNNYKYLPNK